MPPRQERWQRDARGEWAAPSQKIYCIYQVPSIIGPKPDYRCLAEDKPNLNEKQLRC